MAKPIHALDFLANPEKHAAAPFIAVFGDEAYLKREVLTALRSKVLGEDDGEFCFTALQGRDAEYRDVADELATLALFGAGKRLVLIEAGLTGILGAAVSLGVARILDSVISQFARRFLEQRIRQDFDFDIFVYSFTDVLIVVVIAITICMVASLLPARRAAKLDPVLAMK